MSRHGYFCLFYMICDFSNVWLFLLQYLQEYFLLLVILWSGWWNYTIRLVDEFSHNWHPENLKDYCFDVLNSEFSLREVTVEMEKFIKSKRLPDTLSNLPERLNLNGRYVTLLYVLEFVFFFQVLWFVLRFIDNITLSEVLNIHILLLFSFMLFYIFVCCLNNSQKLVKK